MRLDPLTATMRGWPRYHDRLPDRGADGRDRARIDLQALSARLATIDREALSSADRVTFDVARFELDDRLEGLEQPLYQLDVDPMDGPQVMVGVVVELRQPMASEADGRALLARCKAMGPYFQGEIAGLREGLAAGRAVSRMPISKVIGQLEALVAAPPEDCDDGEAGRERVLWVLFRVPRNAVPSAIWHSGSAKWHREWHYLGPQPPETTPVSPPARRTHGARPCRHPAPRSRLRPRRSWSASTLRAIRPTACWSRSCASICPRSSSGSRTPPPTPSAPLPASRASCSASCVP